MASVSVGMRWNARDDGVSKRKSEGKSSVTSCTALKTAFHECFNRWYSEKFVKGQWEQEDCMAEWEAYRVCTAKRFQERNLSHLLKEDPLKQTSDRSDK